MDTKPLKPIPNLIQFVLGGTAGMMASSIVHPTEIVKNRMQMQTEKISASAVISSVLKTQGISGMYTGLTASLFRQSTYTTARLGVYNILFDLLKNPDGTPPDFKTKAGLGIVAGACGAIVGTPADVCLIRMTSDGRLPPAERRNYTHIGNAIYRIIKEEGVLTLWRGCIPTVIRGCVSNGVQLASYSQAKQMILSTNNFDDGLLVHFMASMLSGFATAFASLPVDILKTRIQSMKIVNGVPEYKGSLDAFMKIVSKEGIPALWKGFWPYYTRVGPHTVLTFIFLEQLTRAYRSF